MAQFCSPETPRWGQEAQGPYSVNPAAGALVQSLLGLFSAISGLKVRKGQQMPAPSLFSSALQVVVQTQHTGPGCQEPWSPDTRLSPCRSSKVASPSFGILGGPTTAPGEGQGTGEEAKSFLLSVLFSRLGASPWASEPWHCLSSGLAPAGLGPSTRALVPDCSVASVPVPPSGPPAQGGQEQLRNLFKV